MVSGMRGLRCENKVGENEISIQHGISLFLNPKNWAVPLEHATCKHCFKAKS